MEIIDLLNKKADKSLKDNFRFVYDNRVFIFNKKTDKILDVKRSGCIGEYYKIENILLDKIEFIREAEGEE
ncbi:MAG: hypothetical protein ACLR44_05135 [Clostridia bacterium]